PHSAHGIAAVGIFDLDDLSAHVREEHRAVRPRQHPGEIEHTHPGEEPPSAHRALARRAADTAAGVIGSSRNRMPIASWTAFATAADTGITPDSPSPLAPNGPSTSTVSMKRTASLGMSSALRIA